MGVDTVIVTGVTASGCIGNSLVLSAWTTLFDFAAELYGRHQEEAFSGLRSAKPHNCLSLTRPGEGRA
jgi:hypothetical protein